MENIFKSCHQSMERTIMEVGIADKMDSYFLSIGGGSTTYGGEGSSNLNVR
jgi:hypothetical protein